MDQKRGGGGIREINGCRRRDGGSQRGGGHRLLSDSRFDHCNGGYFGWVHFLGFLSARAGSGIYYRGGLGWRFSSETEGAGSWRSTLRCSRAFQLVERVGDATGEFLALGLYGGQIVED